ncbi:MAG: hypothetical protein HKL96_04080 [Phycisphaerales bacterium]|nr:hypothetical protein [Phycisphaerales bacterium]
MPRCAASKAHDDKRASFHPYEAGCAGNADILSASARVWDCVYRFRERQAAIALYPEKARGDANKIAMLARPLGKITAPEKSEKVALILTFYRRGVNFYAVFVGER